MAHDRDIDRVVNEFFKKTSVDFGDDEIVRRVVSAAFDAGFKAGENAGYHEGRMHGGS